MARRLTDEPWLPRWYGPEYLYVYDPMAGRYVKQETLASYLRTRSERRTLNPSRGACNRCGLVPPVVCRKPDSPFFWCEFCWSPVQAGMAGYPDPCEKGS